MSWQENLKASKKNRYETRRKQQVLEKENDRIKSELEKLNQRINHTNILKYKLWEECNNTCPFTGKVITISLLFTGEIQIEHIFPWSRSLNDSFNNKLYVLLMKTEQKKIIHLMNSIVNKVVKNGKK